MRVLTYAGTAAFIVGVLMVVFGSIELLGVRIPGDVSPGGSPAARFFIGLGLLAVSLLLRRVVRSGRAG